MTQTRYHLHSLPLALAVCAALTACGGGGGGSSSGTGTGSGSGTATTPGGAPAAKTYAMTGTAVDGPIANARITITSVAPLGDTGAVVLGTATADATGNYTVNPTLPSGSVPIFGNVTDPSNPALSMSSYLGQSDTLEAAGTLSSSSIPNLNITPVTTAALAVYSSRNAGDFSKLSASAYSQALTNYNSTVVTIASAIKAIGDQLCTPATPVSSTYSMAVQIAQQAAAAANATDALNASINALGQQCAQVVAALPTVITSDPATANQMSHATGASPTTPPAVPAGTYQLQGVLMQSGLKLQISILDLLTAVQEKPADVVIDPTVTVDSSGKITSADGQITGQVTGSLLKLTLVDAASGTTYTLSGSASALPAVNIKGSGYSLRTGGTYPSSLDGAPMLAKFDAVLVAKTATPVWNGIPAPTVATSAQNVNCGAGQLPLRLDIYGLSPSSSGVCVTPTATSWTFYPALSGTVDAILAWAENWFSTHIYPLPSMNLGTWSERSDAPFILNLSEVTNLGNFGFFAFTGSGYYVMGSQSLILSGTGGFGSQGISTNIAITMHDLALDTPVQIASGALPLSNLSKGFSVLAQPR